MHYKDATLKIKILDFCILLSSFTRDSSKGARVTANLL